METVEEHILAYPHRPPDEQREVEAYVEAHPEWAPLLHDVQSIEQLVREPALLNGMATPEPFLATYVVMTHAHPDAIPSELDAAFSRLEAQIDKDPALQDHVSTLRQRLERVEASLDPVTQFERLTGHTLPEDPDTQPEPPTVAESTSQSPRPQGPSSPFDRLLRLPRVMRWAGALALFLLGAYALLFAVSNASQSPAQKLAVIESDRVVESYSETNTRSAGRSPNMPRAQQLYLEARTILQDVRTSTLGLFPRYDAEALDRAQALLSESIEETEPDSFLALEAHFYLGKVHLAQEQVDAARSHFQTVVEREGRLAADAQRILDRLDAEYSERDGR